MFVALGAQCEMRMRHIVNYGLSGSNIFFRILSKTVRFAKEKTSLIMKYVF
jgi:hypothetical protein